MTPWAEHTVDLLFGRRCSYSEMPPAEYNDSASWRNRRRSWFTTTIRVLVSVTISAMVAILLRRTGWAISIGSGLLAMAMQHLLSELDRFRPLAQAHVQRSIRSGRCPWCQGLLTPAAADDERTCTACDGRWWDRAWANSRVYRHEKHREHVLAANLAAALGGLWLGTMMFMFTGSGPWKE